MVQKLDLLQFNINQLVDGYGSSNPTQIVAYNNRLQKIIQPLNIIHITQMPQQLELLKDYVVTN